MNVCSSNIAFYVPTERVFIQNKTPRTEHCLGDGDVELKQVCWLEVTTTIPLSELKPGKYNVSFKVRLKQDAFGYGINFQFR
ncbi:hypothetical protein FRX31_020030 [Thalictrum thalictroides]|uniref:Uncharacterized protein n=1 Tax=Thalictrum thalictroides TaxID=46969 RepID=A0A7J6VZW1_THATH|nr:hypothetical protein FRX31_020030 [Thalictrum thalictroides]